MTTEDLTDILCNYLLSLRRTRSVARTSIEQSDQTTTIHLVARDPDNKDAVIKYFDITVTKVRK